MKDRNSVTNKNDIIKTIDAIALYNQGKKSTIFNLP
jgi:hypothetical protein